MVKGRLHFSFEAYCILCRDSLLDIQPTETPATPKPLLCTDQDWRKDGFVFFRPPNINKTGDARRLHSFRVDLSVPDWHWKHKSMTRLQRLLPPSGFCSSLEGCDRCSREAEECIYISHAACIQLACRVFKKDTIEVLDQLAALGRPILGQKYLSSNAAFQHVDFLRHPSQLIRLNDVCLDTNLGKFLRQIDERLPMELQHAILSRTSGLFRSLLRTSVTLNWASSALASLPRQTVTVLPTKPLAGCGTVTSIGANTISILDEMCLAQITIDDPNADDSIRILDTPVFGFQVSFGTYGVSALRVLYCDGRTSPWLGSPLEWFTTRKCSNLDQLRTFSDGLKILRIDVECDEADPAIDTFMMNHNFPTFNGRQCSIIDADDYGYRILGNSDLRLAEYLALDTPDEPISSLTVHLDGTGIRLIQVNDDPSRIIGTRKKDSVAVTHYFHEGEYIKSVHIVTHGPKTRTVLQGPFILVITSQDRALYYGVHAIPWYPDGRLSDFNHTDARRVVGIFVDPTHATLRLKSIGIATEPAEHSDVSKTRSVLLLSQGHIDNAAFVRRYMHVAFLNTAVLTDVRSLVVQKVPHRNSHRAVGLRIGYHDGSTGTLGQWDPNSKMVYLVHHLLRDGPLETLTFFFSPPASPHADPHVHWVEDVEVGSPSATTRPYFTWRTLNLELAWMFTTLHDNIERWKGNSPNIRLAQSDIPPTEVM